MLFYLIPLVGEFLSVPFLRLWFFPFIALCFLATVPVIIRSFFNRG